MRRPDSCIPFWDETCLRHLEVLSEGLGRIRERHEQKAAGDDNLVAKPDELNPIHG